MYKIHRETLGQFQYQCHGDVFPIGNDSLALGEFATVRKNFAVCDLGTGSGLLLLLLANREASLSLTGIEQDSAACENAKINLIENHLLGDIICENFSCTTATAGHFDLVISNPPYFPINSGGVRDSARSETTCTLESLCKTASRLLKNGGRFALVHRPERLVDVFSALRSVNIEPKRMKFLAHSPQHTPSAVLIEGVRQGRSGLSIEV